MFTGIIQELGRLESITSQGGRSRILLTAQKIAGEVQIGDSVAVSGVCLTAVSISGAQLEFDVVKTTLDRTRLGALQNGAEVNLELALRLDDRLGGHLVSGHIDGVGRIKRIDKKPEEWRFAIEAPSAVRDFLIERGSVAIDGISLTVANISERDFEVAIIPHTLEETTLGTARVGDPVNLEGDLIGKWVAKHLQSMKKGGGITMKKLLEEGYGSR